MKKLLLFLLLLPACAFGQKVNLPTQVRGILPCQNMPALTGDVTTVSGNCTATASPTFALKNGIQQQSYIYSADSGGANAYVVTLSPAPSLVAGSEVCFLAANGNSGASTLAVNGGSAKSIKKNGSSALGSGDIAAGQIVCAIYDGANFQLTSPPVSGAGTVTTSGTPAVNQVALFSASTAVTGTATDSTTTHALFATAGAPAFRALQVGDLPVGFTAFSNLTSSTNTTAAMLCGTGCSFGFSGSGTNNASTLLGGTWAIPGTIGSTTKNTGAFTTISATGQITSTQATGTAPFSVASTTVVPNLNVSQLLGGTWAVPGTIGSTTPNTGVFTALNGAVFALNGGNTVQQAMTAASTNGLSIVPTTYAASDIPSGTQINSLTTPASSSQSDGSQVFDNRFGQFTESYFNPSTTQLGNFAIAHGIIGNWTKMESPVPSNTFLLGIQQNAYDGGANYSGNKSNYESLFVQHIGWTQGQHIGLGAACIAYGTGDCLAASVSALSFGGSNATSDEGVELGDVSISQGNVAAVGTVASGGTAGSTAVTLTFSAGGGTQGSGRYLIDTTGASSTGLVTTIAGTGPATYTFSGVTMATDTITTDSTVISAPGTATITTVGATTGITANTTLVCISDTAEFECFIPTAKGANSLTATFRKPHPSGATLSWGGNAGKLIELNIDRWTTTGPIGFINVLNTLRQAWPVVGCPTTATCTVWISTGGAYQSSYTGQAAVSAGSNAYTMYPGAEILSVQSGGTVSNTITLAPNNVTFGTHAIEIPLYPGQKEGFWNAQVNRFFPSSPGAATGGGISYNGIFNNADVFWSLSFTPPSNSIYANHGGNMQAPLAAFRFQGPGPVRYGLYFDNMPDTATINIGCPTITGCTNSNIFQQAVIAINGNNGIDWLLHNASTGEWTLFSAGGFGKGFTFPLITGAHANGVSGAADLPVEVGYVSCTQANCASSATTLYATPAANSLYRADVSIACTTSTSTATGLVTISYTDISNTAQTFTSTTATCTTLGASSVGTATVSFTAKASTNIQYSVTQANSPAGLQARVAIFQESTN